jgi:type IV pilus biogenesis protein CpaD/CtpE
MVALLQPATLRPRLSLLVAVLATLLSGCASTGPASQKDVDSAECDTYAKPFEHSGRMKHACMISRGHERIYTSNGGWLYVRSSASPLQPAQTVATDLKTCNDAAGMGYQGREQFAQCMNSRGYVVRLP